MKPGRAIPPLLDNKGLLVYEDREKAAIFNEFFASTFVDDNGITPKFPSRVMADTNLSDISFAVEDVYNALIKLPPKLSPTPDDLPSLLLHELSMTVM